MRTSIYFALGIIYLASISETLAWDGYTDIGQKVVIDDARDMKVGNKIEYYNADELEHLSGIVKAIKHSNNGSEKLEIEVIDINGDLRLLFMDSRS